MKRFFYLLVVTLMIGGTAQASSFMLVNQSGDSQDMSPYFPSMSSCLSVANARNTVAGKTRYRCLMVNADRPRSTPYEERRQIQSGYRPPHAFLRDTTNSHKGGYRR